MKYLEKSERRQFIKVADQTSKRDSLAFSLILALALRVGEAVQVRMDDFIKIHGKVKLKVKALKNGLEGEYPIEGELLRKYKAWLRERKKEHVVRRDGENDWLFPHRFLSNDHISRETLQTRFKIISEKIGVKDHSIHSLRHSAAMHLAEKGKSVYEIAEYMRQRSILSAQHYITMVTRKEKLSQGVATFSEYL